MRVLITGTDGYIGCLLAGYLMDAGHDVVGLDTNYFHDALLGAATAVRLSGHRQGPARRRAAGPRRRRRGGAPGRPVERRAGRAVAPRHLRHQPPRHGAAGHAVQAGRRRAVRLLVVVQRLRQVERRHRRRGVAVRSADRLRRVQDAGRARAVATWPTTASRPRSCATPRPTAPRRACGSTWWSTTCRRWRGPSKRIAMVSDGTPWRPIVHVLDICAAFRAALDAPREAVHNQRVQRRPHRRELPDPRDRAVHRRGVPGLRGHLRQERSRPAQLPRELRPGVDGAARVPLRVGPEAGRRAAAGPLRAREAAMPRAWPTGRSRASSSCATCWPTAQIDSEFYWRGCTGSRALGA